MHSYAPLRLALHGQITLLYLRSVCAFVSQYVTTELVSMMMRCRQTLVVLGVDGWKYQFNVKSTRTGCAHVLSRGRRVIPNSGFTGHALLRIFNCKKNKLVDEQPNLTTCFKVIHGSHFGRLSSTQGKNRRRNKTAQEHNRDSAWKPG